MAEDASNRFILQVNSLLDEHLPHSSYRINDLAKDLHVSRVHLYRKIKAETGKSCTEYILERKLEHAYYLLRNSRRNVTEVAYEVGFNNLSYFARAFRARFSMNPSEVARTYN